MEQDEERSRVRRNGGRVFEDPLEALKRDGDTASADRRTHALTKGLQMVVLQEPDLAWSQITTGGGDVGKMRCMVWLGFRSRSGVTQP